MSGFTVKKIDEMEAVYGGAFKRARAELGVSSFGMQFLDLPPNIDMYPEHDHGSDGQEEAYVVMRGGGEIEIEGERHQLDPDTVVRVGPGVTRKVWPGDEGVRLLILGGVPGKAYEVPDATAVTELGAPDPMAQQA
jgi:mannose-6-phosphate isomerase-like protein (cupin superfamily)